MDEKMITEICQFDIYGKSFAVFSAIVCPLVKSFRTFLLVCVSLWNNIHKIVAPSMEKRNKTRDKISFQREAGLDWTWLQNAQNADGR